MGPILVEAGVGTIGKPRFTSLPGALFHKTRGYRSPPRGGGGRTRGDWTRCGDGEDDPCEPVGPDRIWRHYSGLSISVDRKQIYNYVCVSEFSPMGVVAHEYGHDLGLPDLYDTDYSSDGVGRWCLMGAGSWNPNPSHMMRWCKMMLGWLTPSLASGNSVISATLQNVELFAEVYKVPVTATEYFLVENRYAQGAVFDQHGGANLPAWGKSPRGHRR